MPALSLPMPTIADALAVAAMKKLAYDWKQPSGDPAGKQYPDAFKPSERTAVPDPMCYFHAASTNKYHVDQSKKIGGQFKDFNHAMLDGFKSAVDMWRLQAKLSSLILNAGMAVGAPGCLKGPELESNIKNLSLPAASGNEKKWRDAVAKGLSKQWKQWQDLVTVPGLPWYPAHIVFPGPMAPPMPNIPTPLMACPSGGMSFMTPSMLENAMVGEFSLDDPDKQFQNLTAKPIGTAIAGAFMAWLGMQQMMLCMGKGSIPTFAPPYVPVGPVVMGDNISAPGHSMA